MKIFYICIALLALSCALHGFGETVTLSEKQSNEIKQRLEAYERGALTLEEIAGPKNITDASIFTNMTVYFEAHSNQVTLKMLLPISQCFLLTGGFSEAARLARDYLNVYSNDCAAWGVLVPAKAMTESYGEALRAGTTALQNGCEKQIAPIGLMALNAQRFDLLENTIIPRLLIIKDAEKDLKIRREMLNVLVMYSVIATNKDLYVKALRGETARDLGDNLDLRRCVQRGCELFKAKETEKLCRELAE